MQINLVYDSSVGAAPTAFTTAMAAAAQYLDNVIVNPITVNIAVGYGEDDGSALGAGVLGEGGPSNGTYLSYSQLEAALAANATSAADATVLADLPVIDPSGGRLYYITSAQEKAWGLASATATAIDGSVGYSATAAFTYDPNNRAVANKVDFIGTALHELTHALGRYADNSPTDPSLLDLFRYSSIGRLQFSGTKSAYFSIDGGRTNLGTFDSTSDASDWASGTTADSFNAYSSSGVVNGVTPVDLTEMDVLGFDIAGTGPSVAGALAGQTTTDATSVSPFATLSITDPNTGQTETATVTLSATANGALGNLAGGSYNATTGVYSISGSLAAIVAALDGLVFTPTRHQVTPGQTVQTVFTVKVTDASGASASNATTTVTTTAIATPPVITGLPAAESTTDTTAIRPFAQVVVTDANFGIVDTATVTLSSTANGSFSMLASGTYNPATGIYSVTGSAAVVTAALNGLVFTPTLHEVATGQAISSGFTLKVSDSAAASVAASTTLTTAGSGSVQSSSGFATINAGNGSQVVTLPAGAVSVSSGGANTIVASTGAVTISAQTGNPLIYGNGAALTFVGGDGAATVNGSTGGNTITGGSGSLLLFAPSQTTYTGGTGAATIIGGLAPINATLGGGGLVFGSQSGGDVFTGGIGSATIIGGGGPLAVNLGSGGGVVFGSRTGGDTLTGGSGNAILVGGAAGDVVRATGPGQNVLIAGAGPETLSAAGSSGDDVFYGGTGADCIVGGAGGDFIIAGQGNATLTGGGGGNAYAFAMQASARTDTITDFDTTRNAVGLFGYGDQATADAAALASAVVAGGNTMVSLSDGTRIIFLGVTQLHSYNFF